MKQHEIPGHVAFMNGNGGLAKAVVTSNSSTAEIYLHGADDKDYRARFTLIRTGGRWWIDDVHWTQEADEHDVSHT